LTGKDRATGRHEDNPPNRRLLRMIVPSGLEEVTAVILAGGMGTRIQAIHPGLPKPMIPVSGRPFVEWVVRHLRAQGLCRAIISSGHLAEIVSAHFAAQPVEGMAVEWVAEPEPMGTAGGFLFAASAVGPPPKAWLVLNGDSLALVDYRAAARVLGHEDTQAVVVGIEVPDTTRYGKLVFDHSGRLLRFGEKEPGQGVVNAGIYFFKHSLLAGFPARRPLSFEKEVFPALLAGEVRIQVHVSPAEFLDIGTPESLPLAEPFIRQNQKAFQAP